MFLWVKYPRGRFLDSSGSFEYPRGCFYGSCGLGVTLRVTVICAEGDTGFVVVVPFCFDLCWQGTRVHFPRVEQLFAFCRVA